MISYDFVVFKQTVTHHFFNYLPTENAFATTAPISR